MKKNYANLLPEDYRRRRLVRRRLLQWIMISLVVVVGCVSTLIVRGGQLSRLQRAVAERRRVYAPTKTMLAEIPRMEYEMQELSRRDGMVAKLRDPRPPLTAIGMVSQSAARCKGGVRVLQLIVERPETTPPPLDGDAAEDKVKSGLITIQGTGADNPAVAQFVASLRRTQAFRRVDLKSSVRGRFALSDVQRFVVECEF